MQNNDALDNIRQILVKRRAGQAITSLQDYLLTHPQQQYMERLMAISNDYKLMADYWQRGLDDPMRAKVNSDLLKRLYVLVSDVETSWHVEHSAFLKAIHLRPRRIRKDWTVGTIRADLEGYVSDVAMLQLEEGQDGTKNGTELYQRHWNIVHDLFDYIVTSRQWKEGLANAFIDMLLSPTLDSADQQLIVSAVTLSSIQHFCIQKFRVLMTVYKQSTDNRVKQRALVGWALTLDSQADAVFPELREMVAEACADEHTRNELTELQMQLYLCMDAEDDTNTIQKEILPDIMSGSHLKITRKGLVETDEDPLDEILHPEESEKDMERMEQSMKRMVDMQKQGADIYFGGFSQMKRYPFFNDICNWFMPFSGNHPAISNIWNREKGHRFLDVITRVGAFCDSDKYSFVLAFDMVMERLPKSMLKLVEQGEASPIPIGGEIDEEEQQQPAFLRRMYLQDMYRFYKLYSARSEFRNPFASEQSILLFFANPLVKGSELERQFAAVARFLMKRHRNKEAMDVLENLTEQNRNFQYYMMMGNILQHVKNSSHISAMECFRKALQLQPDNDKAQAGYARTLFNEQYFDMALKEYRSMLNRNPNHQGYQLRAAVCMTNLGQADEALKLLFKLNYENPEDDTVNRVLAWTMTIAGKYEQAEKIYCRLLDAEVTEPTDMLNYGYNLWFSRKIDTAAGMFRQYCEMQHDNAFSIENEILVNERQLIANHGIGDTEMLLMVDAVENG